MVYFPFPAGELGSIYSSATAEWTQVRRGMRLDECLQRMHTKKRKK